MSEIFTLEKIYKAYLDCRKRKKNTINALKFEINRERNLIDLKRELLNKNYQISRHTCFVVIEPNYREIFAADFRDRIVHHLIFNELNPYFEEDFVENSFASRKDKGTHKGVKILRGYLKEMSHEGYFLKLDIKSFFCAIDKNVLFKIISEKVKSTKRQDYWKNEILWISKKIIYHDPTKNYVFKGNPENKKLISREKSLFFSNGKGLPIGNLTSQFFANAYLDKLDHFINDELRVEKYLRYVDDIVLLGKNKSHLLGYIKPIKEFLESNLDLKLNQNKTKLQPINNGIDFLGYFVRPKYVLVRRKIVARLKKELLKDCILYGSAKNCGNIDIKRRGLILAMINSYYGHFGHAFTFNLRKDIYDNHLGRLQINFLPKSNYSSLKHVK